MHITLETDYAVRIIDCLVQNGRRMDAKTISEKTEVTLRFSLKILRKLVSGGLVKSFKGTQGGYELAQTPEELSLYDVIKTVQGPYLFSRCLAPDFNCNFTDKCAKCKFYAIYDQLTAEVVEKLSAVKFADLIEKKQQP